MDRDKIFQFLALILRDYIQQQQISQAEFATQIGCSQSRLNDFLNKKGEIGSAKFDLILRLFPELQRPILSYLESRGGGIQQVANGNILSTITQTAGGSPAGDAEALRDRVIRSIIDLELPAEVQQLVLKTIKNA